MRRSTPWFVAALCVTLTAFSGCLGQESTPDVPLPTPKSEAELSTPGAEFEGKISKVMNDVTARYRPLEYEYDEDLLRILDRLEKRISGKSDKLEPLPIPSLDEAEQLAHFKESTQRWESRTKKSLRKELDPLLAEVAARKPGEKPFHPEFHKKFSASFDEWIPIEVAEIRERRNKALHAAAQPIIDEYRSKAADAVKNAEQTLNNPPYNLVEPAK